MKDTNQNTRGFNSTANSCTSGGDPPDPPHGFKALHERWPEFVDAVKDTHVAAGSILTDAKPITVYGGVLWVLVPKSLHQDALRDNKDLITEQFTSTLGVPVSAARFVLPSDFGKEQSDEDATSERPGDDSGKDVAVDYEDLFGRPPSEPDDDRGQSPPSPPPPDRPVSEAERSVYEAAFRVAYERPGELMDVLELVRKGLQRGQKSAESGGDYRG